MSDNKDLSASTEYSEGTTNEGGQQGGRRGRGGRGRGGRGRGEGGRGRGRGPVPEIPGHRVSISHLPKDTSKENIALLCQPYGKINDVYMKKYEAIVTFDKYSDATYAIFDLSQKKYRDDHITVEWARQKKQFNDKDKKDEEGGENTEKTSEENKEKAKESGSEKKPEDKDQKQKKDAKEPEKKEEKPPRPLLSEMQKLKDSGSNPGNKQQPKKKAPPKNKVGKQAETKAQEKQETISVAQPEPVLKAVASQPPAENGDNAGNKKRQNKKQQQKQEATQEKQSDSGKPARFEVKMREINTRDVKSTLNSVSAEDIERFLKPLVPIFEVTVKNETTGEEKVYGLTDYHLKNNFTPFVQAYYSQLGDK